MTINTENGALKPGPAGGAATAIRTLLMHNTRKALLAFALGAQVMLSHATTLHLAGDSTMAIKEVKDYPETGWGVPFSYFFADDVRVVNHAKNGRSTRTFIEEGRWKNLYQSLQAGDIVFIQFGHNDESEHKVDRYTPPEQFKANLRRFIREARDKGAESVLLTPITRRYFDGPAIRETHPVYAALTRKVATEQKVVLLDMDGITREHFSAQGEELSRLRFMHIAPGLHPNYPIGVKDDTHLNQLGAREVAQLVLRELKRLQHPLANRLRVPDPKHL